MEQSLLWGLFYAELGLCGLGCRGNRRSLWQVLPTHPRLVYQQREQFLLFRDDFCELVHDNRLVLCNRSLQGSVFFNLKSAISTQIGVADGSDFWSELIILWSDQLRQFSRILCSGTDFQTLQFLSGNAPCVRLGSAQGSQHKIVFVYLLLSVLEKLNRVFSSKTN